MSKKMNVRQLLSLCLLCGITLLGIACKKDDKATPTVEQAKVTGLSMMLSSDQKGIQDVNVLFKDATGLGGKTSPNVITLDANTIYTGTLALEDATQSPAKVVTTDYQVTFQVASADATFSMSGQEVQITTRAASTGSNGMLHVELKQGSQVQKVSFPLMVRQ
ncbi:hypothetical protein [Pontibacter anaerobius]|uniref:Uncharacterized protein n=1 Tax=Pontibacter anaerobius TaxID=2993940 RepID=A0ABT3RB22_9BACT|nr:hypothetical protein [Pontibacter anaerobius]MCX2739067.1 hypothetical protein [Pontibacter anaerobius]